MTRALQILRRIGRTIAYQAGIDRLIRVAGLARAKHASAVYWDQSLTGALSSYMGGTLSIRVRDDVIRALIAHYCSEARCLVDIGCASGSLACSLPRTTVRRYLGVDISRRAIDKALARFAENPTEFISDSHFIVADVRGFSVPPGYDVDIFVFSEVLYYLDPDEAVNQVLRLLTTAGPAAQAIVSMKDDPKSTAIFRRLARALTWRSAILFQEIFGGCRFRTRFDTARPAYLAALLQAPNCTQCRT